MHALRHRSFTSLLFTVFLLVSCKPLSPSAIPQDATVTLSPTATAISTRPTAAIAISTPTSPKPKDKSYCAENLREWKFIVYPNLVYHTPLSVREGPTGTFWVVSEIGVTKYTGDPVNNVEVTAVFSSSFEALGCEGCESNGSIGITSRGDAWLGTTKGVVIVNNDGGSKIIKGGNIFKRDPGEAAHVELVTGDGKILLTNGGTEICLAESSSRFSCRVLKFLGSPDTPIFEKDHILSAAMNGVDSFWFTTAKSHLILYNYRNDTYQEYDLEQKFPEMEIGSLRQIVVQSETGYLWGISSPLTRKSDKPYLDVFRYSRDGEWDAFDESVFGKEGYGLATIAAMADSIWVGMAYRQGMAYYDYHRGIWRPMKDDNVDDTCWLRGTMFLDISK